ncbi:ATP-dependent helicase, partial [Mycobacterium tuberculosis]
GAAADRGDAAGDEGGEESRGAEGQPQQRRDRGEEAAGGRGATGQGGRSTPRGAKSKRHRGRRARPAGQP